MAFGFAAPYQGNALQGANTAAQQAAAQVAQGLSKYGSAPASAPAPALGMASPQPAANPAPGQTAGASPYGLHLNMPQSGVNMPGYENYMQPAQSAPAAQSSGGSGFDDFLSKLKSGGSDFMSTLASMFGG